MSTPRTLLVPASLPSLEVGELVQLIATRQARIGVIGLGSVGLPLARALLQAGHWVYGIDTDPERVASLQRGETPLAHLGPQFARELIQHPRFCLEPESALDCALIAVPTPLDNARQPDLSCVRAAAAALARSLRPGGLVVLESTSYAGTTREVLGEALRAAGRRPGSDVLLAASPEREDPARLDASMATIPKLVGGTCAASARAAQALYESFVREVHVVESAEIAEAAKLFENVFRAVNIALVNELSAVLHAQGLDVQAVLRAAATKPFGFMPFQPGPGTGGQCIPIDPCYYTFGADRAGERAALVELSMAINRARPQRVVARLAQAFEAAGESLRGKSICVLGLAYKPEVDVTTESPAFEIIRCLREQGAQVVYSDPWVPHCASLGLTSQSPIYEHSAYVLVTDHAAFDYARLAQSGAWILDTRGAFARRGLHGAQILTV